MIDDHSRVLNSLPLSESATLSLCAPIHLTTFLCCSAINHLPLMGLGTRQLRAYDLALTRYDVPELPSSSSMIDSPYLTRPPRDKDKGKDKDSSMIMYTCQPPASTSNSHLPPCQYRITLPSGPAGPGVSFPVSLALQLPPSSSPSSSSPQLALHSLSIVLERRMVFYEASGAESAPELLSGTASSTPEPSPAASRSSFRSTASTATVSAAPAHTAPHTPSSSIGSSTLNALGISIGRKRSASATPSTLPHKSLTNTIATAETTLAIDGNGPPRSAQLTIELAMPPRPPPSQWPVGETTRTDLATIAFYIRIKVGVAVVQPHSPHRPPTSSSSGSTPSSGAAPTVYEYELPEREVQMVSVTEEERALALARIADRRSRSRRASASASDKPVLPGDPGAAAGVPPLPKGASTIKFELDDTLKGGVSAAMLNSRLKSVKANRDAAPVAADGAGSPPPAVNNSSSGSSGSGSGSGSSGSSPYPALPSTGPSSASAPLDTQDTNSYHNTPNELLSMGSKTPRPQTASGTPPPAHNNHENTASPAHLIRMRRSQSGKAMCRPQSEVVSPHELDSARMHGVFLASDWKECGRPNGASDHRDITDGSKSDSEAKVRARVRKDRSPTATVAAMNTIDKPLPIPTMPPPVPSKDDVPPPLPPKKSSLPSPTRPIPPPPSAYLISISSQQQQSQSQPLGLHTVATPMSALEAAPMPVLAPSNNVPKTGAADAWEKILDRLPTRGKRRSDEMRNNQLSPSSSLSLSPSPSPSPSFSSLSPSPPGSAFSHGYRHGHGHARIPQARFNTSARSSPNLLDPLSASPLSASADLARGRDQQRRPRGNSTVSRSRKTGLFSALLSAKA